MDIRQRDTLITHVAAWIDSGESDEYCMEQLKLMGIKSDDQQRLMIREAKLLIDGAECY